MNFDDFMQLSREGISKNIRLAQMKENGSKPSSENREAQTELTYFSDSEILSHKNNKEDQNPNTSKADWVFLGSRNVYSQDFLSLLENSHYSDVNIKCGSNVLKAHKIILCARSPVFETMFNSPMQERERNTVTIDDIDLPVCRDLLTFIYSNQVQNLSLSKACDLLYVAEKYQLNDLKDICTVYLKMNLSVENAFQVLQCAELYDKQLTTDTMMFMSKNFPVLKTTEDWKNMQTNNPTLALKVCSLVIDMNPNLCQSAVD